MTHLALTARWRYRSVAPLARPGLPARILVDAICAAIYINDREVIKKAVINKVVINKSEEQKREFVDASRNTDRRAAELARGPRDATSQARQLQRRPILSRSPTLSLGLFAVLLVAGCSKPVEKSEDVRPVRVMTLAAADIQTVAEFSGEVRPRAEARLGFRVPGKLIERPVEVGSVVKAGQVLARLDPGDLQLAQAAAKAQLDAARTDRDLARADLKRYTELRSRGFISGAELERRQSVADAAEARHAQAEANFNQQGNQNSYAVLRAEGNGMVTAVEAEPGQVLAAGQAVVRMAQGNARDVVFGMPENQVVALRRIGVAEVRLWARPDAPPLTGRIREIAPIADPATRTYATRIALDQAPSEVLLGMTASVRFKAPSAAEKLTLPLHALVRDKNATAVWVVDPKSMTVALVPITVGGTSGNEVLVAQGLTAGQLIVTAGVHKLQAGQKVRMVAGSTEGTP